MIRAGTTSSDGYRVVLVMLAAAVLGVLIGLALTPTVTVPGVANVSGVVSAGIPFARVVLNLAAVATVGLGLLPVLIGFDRPKLTEPVLAKARPLAVASALIWAVAALVTLVLQTAEYRPELSTVGLADVWGYVRSVGAGKALLAVLGFALVLTVLWVLAMRFGEKVPPEVRMGIGLFALLPLPVTGHAAHWRYQNYTMISLELHVLSVVTWVGGLAALIALLAGRRALLAHALPRFSKLATVCLAVSAVTGFFNAIVEIGNNPTIGFWTGVFGTPYGQLALLKVTCICGIAALGAHVRWRLLPRIARHEPAALIRWGAAELTIMGLAFGIATVLSRASVG